MKNKPSLAGMPFHSAVHNKRYGWHETPDLMTERHTAVLERVKEALQADDTGEALYEYLYSKTACYDNGKYIGDTENDGKLFFFQIIGWPEGYHYCVNSRYWEYTGFPGVKKNILDILEKQLT